ncbi:MAG: hypothetical protein M3539_01695 [Acidobacteriota bacterium]|nr:hypothetical protein [Acidobacteriota bacterium]
MSQLTTLIWLKWRLFRNSLRTSKAVANRIASVVGMLAAVALALLIAMGLGIVAYALTSPDIGLQTIANKSSRGARTIPSAEFIFFSIFSMAYLLWATLPLSIGSSRQFDPGNLLLYPISLRRLFALDLLSEFASLQSIFAIPTILAIGVGAGLAQGQIWRGLLIGIVAVVFGVALSKWVSTSIGSLIRKRRTRGETLLALIGAAAGLGGIVFAQIAPAVLRHQESVSALRWTPPGAVAFALTDGLRTGGPTRFALTLILLVAYTVILVLFTYWLARRAAFGSGGSRKRRETPATTADTDIYTGWQIPFFSPALSAVVEKELRYAMRNAQLRMMALMPLILIGLRLMNRRRFGPEEIDSGGAPLVTELLTYGHGLMATGGILYVFLILSGMSCNLFAFEHAGMRALVLSPIDRKTILLGKNIVVWILAFVLSAALLAVNELVFGDLTPLSLLFGLLSFFVYAALMSVMGNWLSIRFPKRMKMGSRMNVSGVVGLLLIPMILLLALPPLAAVAAGYVAQSLLIEYVTLTVLAALSVGFYAMLIATQGESLQQREQAILEAVNDPGND